MNSSHLTKIKSTFPTVRENYEYVGDIFDENEQRHPDHWKIIQRVGK